uniref:P2X purinoceptor n=1 Tax=Pelodiscus sinensis TaxID=13735 RepID=K7FGH9_PELSI
ACLQMEKAPRGGPGARGCWRCFWEFWDYETPKVMVVKSRKLGVMYRGVQGLILFYFVWYVFIVQKGYQERETGPESSVVTKVSGGAGAGIRGRGKTLYGGDPPPQYVYPQVCTCTAVHTCTCVYAPAQVWVRTCTGLGMHRCAYLHSVCSCKGMHLHRCVPAQPGKVCTCPGVHTCPGSGGLWVTWRSTWHVVPLHGGGRGEATLQLRACLPRGNVKDDQTGYLSACTFNETTALYCPIFRLGSIVEQAGENFTALAEQVGCAGDPLPPGLPPPSPASGLAPVGPAWHLPPLHRGWPYGTLRGQAGPRRQLPCPAGAGKFSLIPTIINLATALTSVGVGSFLCDWILLTFMNKNEVYSTCKFDQV